MGNSMMIMNGESGRMRKGIVLAYFKALYQHFDL